MLVSDAAERGDVGSDVNAIDIALWSTALGERAARVSDDVWGRCVEMLMLAMAPGRDRRPPGSRQRNPRSLPCWRVDAMRRPEVLVMWPEATRSGPLATSQVWRY